MTGQVDKQTASSASALGAPVTAVSGATPGPAPVTRRTRSNRLQDRRSHEPAYLRIADTIAEQIGAGFYRAGDQLPTEPQLRAEYGVSPMTVRRAVNILLDQGLVTTTQGKGTFVRPFDLSEAVFRLQEITDSWMVDSSTDILLLEARIVPADAQAATLLELSDGDPVVRLRRLIQRQGAPLIYQVEHVVYDEHRPLVELELQVTSLEGLFHSPQVQGVPSARLTIQAVSLDAEEAGMLSVTEGSPAFSIESLFHDFDGRPVSWGRFLCRADQFRLTTSMGAAPTAAGGGA